MMYMMSMMYIMVDNIIIFTFLLPPPCTSFIAAVLLLPPVCSSIITSSVYCWFPCVVSGMCKQPIDAAAACSDDNK